MIRSLPDLSAAGAVLTFLLLSGLPGCGGGEKPLPARQGRINDYSAILTEPAAAALEKSLERYEGETCHQIVVVIIPSLGEEGIGDFSSRVMADWEIGHSLLENGILLTISLEEGAARIDAGPGVEDIVTSGRAEEILHQEMFPLFGMDRIGEGVARGVEALMEEGRKVSFAPELRPPVCRAPE